MRANRCGAQVLRQACAHEYAGVTQTKRGSLIEAIANVAIGYGIALASQLIIFPLYGIHLPLSTNIAIGLWFTAISIARSYCLRRLFNSIRTRWNAA